MTGATRVGVVGATGKMGSLAAAAIERAADLELAAVVSPREPLHAPSVVWAEAIEALDPAAVTCVVDLTRADVARRTLAWVAANGKDAVIGTSGLTDEDLATLRSRAARSRVLVVPNFSIGAVLLARFAAEAAAHFDSVEVIELHHDAKRDAPSGTAIATARAVAAARTTAGRPPISDRTEHWTLEGARGAEGPGGIRIHAVRLPGLVAHQMVSFSSPGEGLTLRHDTYDRASFMDGLLLALRGLDRVAGVQVGLEHVLDG